MSVMTSQITDDAIIFSTAWDRANDIENIETSHNWPFEWILKNHSASYTKNISMSWRHHDNMLNSCSSRASKLSPAISVKAS